VRAEAIRGVIGTECPRRIFIRSAGTVQTARSMSISDQTAKRASPVRQADKAMNSSISADMLSFCRGRRAAMNGAISSCGIEAWWPCVSLRGAGSVASNWRHAAGLSPLNAPFCVACAKSRSSRSRLRLSINPFLGEAAGTSH
jgi:hypothetical protein